MAIYNTYAKRQRELRSEGLDVYEYDNFPQRLRIQIVQILRDAIGYHKGFHYHSSDQPSEIYSVIHDIICKDQGVFNLGNANSIADELYNVVLQSNDTELILSIVELCCVHLDYIKEHYHNYVASTTIKIKPDEAIADLNFRFKENGIGYSFEINRIIRIDSTYMHSEVAKQVLNLLSNRKFTGANDEYLKAHDHYKGGRNKECLTECLKAFESTMKIICHEKGWVISPQATASQLIQACFDNHLLPLYTQSEFNSLKSLLSSGIPTIRNKVGGHGQGPVLQTVDDRIARYGLNLTGSNIIFLVEQSELT